MGVALAHPPGPHASNEYQPASCWISKHGRPRLLHDSGRARQSHGLLSTDCPHPFARPGLSARCPSQEPGRFTKCLDLGFGLRVLGSGFGSACMLGSRILE